MPAERGPRRAVLILLGTTALFFVLLFAWMSFARLDPRHSGSAPGTDVDLVTHARGYKLLAHELAELCLREREPCLRSKPTSDGASPPCETTLASPSESSPDSATSPSA